MGVLFAFFALFLAIGCVAVWVTWRFTRHIRSIWLRHVPRALVTAAAFTPTIAPIPGLHGALPMPAVWVFLVGGILGEGSGDRLVDLRYGGVPLFVVFVVIWLFSVAIAYARRHSNAA